MNSNLISWLCSGTVYCKLLTTVDKVPSGTIVCITSIDSKGMIVCNTRKKLVIKVPMRYLSAPVTMTSSADMLALFDGDKLTSSQKFAYITVSSTPNTLVLGKYLTTYLQLKPGRRIGFFSNTNPRSSRNQEYLYIYPTAERNQGFVIGNGNKIVNDKVYNYFKQKTKFYSESSIKLPVNVYDLTKCEPHGGVFYPIEVDFFGIKRAFSNMVHSEKLELFRILRNEFGDSYYD